MMFDRSIVTQLSLFSKLYITSSVSVIVREDKLPSKVAHHTAQLSAIHRRTQRVHIEARAIVHVGEKNSAFDQDGQLWS